eukprot:363837-Chlamydomonas_euryale.AAC.5
MSLRPPAPSRPHAPSEAPGTAAYQWRPGPRPPHAAPCTHALMCEAPCKGGPQMRSRDVCSPPDSRIRIKESYQRAMSKRHAMSLCAPGAAAASVHHRLLPLHACTYMGCSVWSLSFAVSTSTAAESWRWPRQKHTSWRTRADSSLSTEGGGQ